MSESVKTIVRNKFFENIMFRYETDYGTCTKKEVLSVWLKELISTTDASPNKFTSNLVQILEEQGDVLHVLYKSTDAPLKELLVRILKSEINKVKIISLPYFHEGFKVLKLKIFLKSGGVIFIYPCSTYGWNASSYDEAKDLIYTLLIPLCSLNLVNKLFIDANKVAPNISPMELADQLLILSGKKGIKQRFTSTDPIFEILS
ncbi:MAG: hypothetical protein GY793_02425 [Proteobacteria bacterium]|nr:hypothetical protein [Pseudomonadota bacterium]